MGYWQNLKNRVAQGENRPRAEREDAIRTIAPSLPQERIDAYTRGGMFTKEWWHEFFRTSWIYQFIVDPSKKLLELKPTSDLKGWSRNYWNNLSMWQRISYVFGSLIVKDAEIKHLMMMAYTDWIGKRFDMAVQRREDIFSIEIHQLQNAFIADMEYYINSFNVERWKVIDPAQNTDTFEAERIVAKLKTDVLAHLKATDTIKELSEINMVVKRIIYDIEKVYIKKWSKTLVQRYTGKPIKEKFDYMRAQIRADPGFAAALVRDVQSAFYQDSYFKVVVKIYDDVQRDLFARRAYPPLQAQTPAQSSQAPSTSR